MKRGSWSFYFIAILVFVGITFGSVCQTIAKEFKPKTLKFATVVPPKSFLGQQQQWWADEVARRTDGRLKVQMFWMESLSKWKDMLHAVSSGIADVGVPSSTYHPSDFRLFMLLDMPYNVKDYWAGMMAAIDVSENEPNLKAELEKAGIKFLAPYASGHFHLGTKEVFKSLADLKGKTFRSYGGARIKWMELLEINPVFMSYADIYEATDRGTINGCELVFQLSDAFKHYEVMKYVGLADSGTVLAIPIAMNLKLWNSLPQDLQDILLQLRTDYAAHYAKSLFDLERGFMEKWKKGGVIVEPLSEADDTIARAAGAEAQTIFLSQQTKNGVAAQVTWDYFLNSQKKYEDEIKAKGYPWEK